MIVCVCNVLNEAKIEAAIAAGACTVGAVYECCGARPQCGQCSVDIAKLLNRERAELAVAAA